MTHRAAIAAVVVLVLSAGPSVAPASERSEDDPGEIRLFKLDHIGTKTAITLFRTLLNTRVVAEVPDQQTVILRDRPETLAQAADILRQVDVPRPRWSAELAVGSAKREQSLRAIDLSGMRAQLRFGQGGGSHVGVLLECEPSGTDAIDVRYEMSVRLVDEQAGAFEFTENGRARLDSGDSLSVFRPETDAQRRALGRILGLEGEAGGVGIRFDLRR